MKRLWALVFLPSVLLTPLHADETQEREDAYQAERMPQGSMDPTQPPDRAVAPKPTAWPRAVRDDRPWARSDPRDPRNSGNLGPAGSSGHPGIGPSAPAGTPGEKVPSFPGPADQPGSTP